MRKPKPFVTFQKKPKVTLVTLVATHYVVLRTYVRSFVAVSQSGTGIGAVSGVGQGTVSRSGTGIGGSKREVMGGSQLIGNWYLSPSGDAGIAGTKKGRLRRAGPVGQWVSVT